MRLQNRGSKGRSALPDCGAAGQSETIQNMERVTCKCGHTWVLGHGGRKVACSQCGRSLDEDAHQHKYEPAKATTIEGLTAIDPREPPDIDPDELAAVEQAGDSESRARSDTAAHHSVAPGMHAGSAAPKSFVKQVV